MNLVSKEALNYSREAVQAADSYIDNVATVNSMSMPQGCLLKPAELGSKFLGIFNVADSKISCENSSNVQNLAGISDLFEDASLTISYDQNEAIITVTGNDCYLISPENRIFQADHALYTPGLDENRVIGDFVHDIWICYEVHCTKFCTCT